MRLTFQIWWTNIRLKHRNRKRVINININILKRIEADFQQSPAQVMATLKISKSGYSMIKNDKMPVSKKLAITINQAYHYSLEDILLRPQVQDGETKLTRTDTCNWSTPTGLVSPIVDKAITPTNRKGGLIARGKSTDWRKQKRPLLYSGLNGKWKLWLIWF